MASEKKHSSSVDLSVEDRRLLRQMASDAGLSVRDFLRRVETAREFGGDRAEDLATQGAVARQRKQLADREREAFRQKRLRAPRGTVIVREPGNAVLVPKAALDRRAKVTKAELEAAPAAFHASHFATPTRQDFWLACQLRSLLEELSGFPSEPPIEFDADGGIQLPAASVLRQMFPDLAREVSRKQLEKLRRAWEGANGPIGEFWEKRLREHVWSALPFRQAGGKAPLPGDGESILRWVVSESPPDTVPPALAAEMIEGVLKTATVTRGGGTKGRTKNVDVALDELILAAKSAGWSHSLAPTV